jgi:hypothetical protein
MTQEPPSCLAQNVWLPKPMKPKSEKLQKQPSGSKRLRNKWANNDNKIKFTKAQNKKKK